MTEHLIDIVRCEPCLYDTNHPDYSKNSLKELLWVKIAKELNYKDGPSAKDAWQKLRNCHRDAIRRRNKLYRTGSAATFHKPWKYEKQMEFLMTYMTNRPTSGNISTGNPGRDQNFIQPEDLINYQEDTNITGNNSNEHSLASFQILPPDMTDNNSTEDSVVSSQLLPYPLLQKDIPHIATPTAKESTTKTTDINTLLAITLQNHEIRARERAEKNAHRAEVDEMQHFFNTMYAMTKKMPALSQHKLKRRIFNLVSDEEEYLLHLGPRSTDINSASGSTLNRNAATTPTPKPSPGNPTPSPTSPIIPSLGTPMPSSAIATTSHDWSRVHSQLDQ